MVNGFRRAALLARYGLFGVRKCGRGILIVVLLLMTATSVMTPGNSRADDEIPSDILEHARSVLNGRWVSKRPKRGSGESQKDDPLKFRGPKVSPKDKPGSSSFLPELFEKAAPSVPFVMGSETAGSGVVVSVQGKPSVGWVVTSFHVVEEYFSIKGMPSVFLLFYDEKISGEFFDGDRFVRCLKGPLVGDWCNAVRGSFRPGEVVGFDPGKDLALLAVRSPPDGVTGISEANLESIRTGNQVAVIGHPKGFLWSLTQGIVSGVRRRFQMGSAYGTIIQTQAPINPGNSGGPLLTPEGKLMGVITWQIRLSQGLNAAVGIDEVRTFIRKQNRISWTKKQAKPRSP